MASTSAPPDAAIPTGPEGTADPGEGSRPAGPVFTARQRWTRRTLIATVVLVAGGALFAASRVAVTGTDSVAPHRIVVERFPLPDAIEPRQTEIRVELLPGYDGKLTVNGVAIPEDEMEGAIDPSSVSEEELRRYGIRPNNRNRVAFKPGEGKAVASLPQGQVTVTVDWWKDRRPGEDPGSLTWTFTVN